MQNWSQYDPRSTPAELKHREIQHNIARCLEATETAQAELGELRASLVQASLPGHPWLPDILAEPLRVIYLTLKGWKEELQGELEV